jgi:hypothetical protein
VTLYVIVGVASPRVEVSVLHDYMWSLGFGLRVLGHRLGPVQVYGTLYVIIGGESLAGGLGPVRL